MGNWAGSGSEESSSVAPASRVDSFPAGRRLPGSFQGTLLGSWAGTQAEMKPRINRPEMTIAKVRCMCPFPQRSRKRPAAGEPAIASKASARGELARTLYRRGGLQWFSGLCRPRRFVRLGKLRPKRGGRGRHRREGSRQIGTEGNEGNEGEKGKEGSEGVVLDLPHEPWARAAN